MPGPTVNEECYLNTRAGIDYNSLICITSFITITEIHSATDFFSWPTSGLY